MIDFVTAYFLGIAAGLGFVTIAVILAGIHYLTRHRK